MPPGRRWSRRSVAATGLLAAVALLADLLAAPAPGAAATTAAVTSAAGVPSAGRFTPVTPTRVFDTRTGEGGVARQPLGPRVTLTVQVAGVGAVPSGATAVALNLTAVGATGSTYITAFPGGASRPATSSLNLSTSGARANFAIVGIGAGGTVSFFNDAGEVELLADVTGYFSAAGTSTYTPLTPVRAFDTRTGSGGVPKQQVGPGATIRARLSGVDGVPTGATAVAVNLTAVDATASTYITAYPDGAARPHTSTLNVATQSPVPNAAIVPVGSTGYADFYNDAGTVDLVADIAGYFGGPSGATFTPITPRRVFDTRNGTGVARTALGPAASLRAGFGGIPGIPAYASAVAVNVTAVGATESTYVTAFADGMARPPTSTLNAPSASPVANFAAMPVGAQGMADFFNRYGTVNLLADVVGYFVPPWPVASPPLPADAAAAPNAEVDDVGCGAGYCGAAGEYQQPDGTWRDVLWTATDPGTGDVAAARAPLPADAAASGDPDNRVTGISCGTGFCVAVGSYRTAGNTGMRSEGALWGWAPGHAWSVTRTPLPAGTPTTDPDTVVAGVSCSGASCVAVGTYADAAGDYHGALWRLAGSTWSVATAPLPTAAAAAPHVGLTAVSCTGSGCTAVGEFTDTSGRTLGATWTSTGSGWTVRTAPLPPGADATAPAVHLTDVACVGSACTAVGGYALTGSGGPAGAFWRSTSLGGSWAVAAAPRPANASTAYPGVFVDAVACSGVGCVATGSYQLSEWASQGLTWTSTGGSWQDAVPPLPAGTAAVLPSIWLDAVACGPTACAVADSTRTSDVGRAAALSFWRSTGWTTTPLRLPPGAVGSAQAAAAFGVSCGASAGCLAGGTYVDGLGVNQPALWLAPATG